MSTHSSFRLCRRCTDRCECLGGTDDVLSPQHQLLDGRLPVIFLKDVSSKDYERFLSYMYHGEVSVPQAELLSLISAAKSLGIRGLAEETDLDVVSDDSDRLSGRTVYLKDVRGVKRDGELLESRNLVHKKTMESIPKLQQEIGPKL